MILSTSEIESDHEGFYVEFDGDFMEDRSQPVRIWTRKIRRGGGGGGEQNVGVPLVMVHGLAAGTAMFAINFDGLAKYRYRALTCFRRFLPPFRPPFMHSNCLSVFPSGGKEI